MKKIALLLCGLLLCVTSCKESIDVPKVDRTTIFGKYEYTKRINNENYRCVAKIEKSDNPSYKGKIMIKETPHSKNYLEELKGLSIDEFYENMLNTAFENKKKVFDNLLDYYKEILENKTADLKNMSSSDNNYTQLLEYCNNMKQYISDMEKRIKEGGELFYYQALLDLLISEDELREIFINIEPSLDNYKKLCLEEIKKQVDQNEETISKGIFSEFKLKNVSENDFYYEVMKKSGLYDPVLIDIDDSEDDYFLNYICFMEKDNYLNLYIYLDNGLGDDTSDINDGSVFNRNNLLILRKVE